MHYSWDEVLYIMHICNIWNNTQGSIILCQDAWCIIKYVKQIELSGVKLNFATFANILSTNITIWDQEDSMDFCLRVFENELNKYWGYEFPARYVCKMDL